MKPKILDIFSCFRCGDTATRQVIETTLEYDNQMPICPSCNRPTVYTKGTESIPKHFIKRQ